MTYLRLRLRLRTGIDEKANISFIIYRRDYSASARAKRIGTVKLNVRFNVA